MGLHGGPAALAILCALLGILGWGWPHTELKESVPARDSFLDESPGAVTLTYTTEVRLTLSTVTVRSAAEGREVTSGALEYLAEDRHDVLVLTLAEPLATGGYTVAWTTAGPDGHALSGEFAFRVDLPRQEPEPEAAGADSAAAAGQPPAEEEAARGGGPADTGSAPSIAPTAIRFLFYLGIVGLLGAVAFRFLVLGQTGRAGESRKVIDAATTRAWKIATLSVAVLLLSVPFRLWFQTQAFFPDAVASNLFGVATGTAWGAGWWLQAGLGLLIAAGIALSRPSGLRTAGWGVIALGVLLLPVVAIVSGHAWAASPRTIAAGATYLHVVAAGSWVGGLFCLVFAGLPALRTHGDAEAREQPGLAGMVNAFSRVALVAVGLLALTGIIKVWVHIGAFSELWTTAWGRSLLVKVLIVAGVMALGFYNWRVVRPALADSPRPGLLRIPALVELLLGAAAVIATSFLVAQPLS